MEPDPECPICLISLNGSPTITVNCCNKQFHTVCYTKCMISKMACPMCRANQSITTETIITINPVNQVRPQIVQNPPIKYKNFLYKLFTTVVVGCLLVVFTRIR